MVYYRDENGKLLIRKMKKDDAEIIHAENLSHGWHSEIEIYAGYYEKQEKGQISVFAAEYEGELVGYTTLRKEASAGPFANKGIPEVSDFNVFSAYRRKGIGSRILDAAESEAQKLSDRICLGVGLHSGYGAAQRLYVKRGYIPDGSGCWYRDRQAEPYADFCNDDDLVLYLSKCLKG